MMSLFLTLSCFSQSPLWLTDGRRLMCDAFQRQEHRVIIALNGQVFSLENRWIDWGKTLGYRDSKPMPLKKKSRSQKEPKGQGEARPTDLMIAKLDVVQTSLIDLLRFMADMADLNLAIDGSVKDEKVTYRLHNIAWSEAMTVILMNAQLDFHFTGGHLMVRELKRFAAGAN